MIPHAPAQKTWDRRSVHKFNLWEVRPGRTLFRGICWAESWQECRQFVEASRELRGKQVQLELLLF